jgi:hypothetical protein
VTIKAVTYYTIVCDECGKDAFADDEYSAWADPSVALDTVEDWGEWSIWPPYVVDGTKHRCPDHNPFCEKCGKDAGEFSGERDYMCQECWDKE